MKKIKEFPRNYGGYLIVASLCNLLHVKLNNDNARNFVLNCMDNLDGYLADCLYRPANKVHNYYFHINDEIINAFTNYLNKTSSLYGLDNFIKTANEYEAEHGSGKPTDIIIKSTTNLSLNWKNNEISIFIPDGTLKNLSDCALIVKYFYFYSKQFAEIKIGNVNESLAETGDYEMKNNSIYMNTIGGKVVLTSIEGIDYSKYATLFATFSIEDIEPFADAGVVLGLSSSALDFNGWVKYEAIYGKKVNQQLSFDLANAMSNLYIQLSYYRAEGNLYEIGLIMNKAL